MKKSILFIVLLLVVGAAQSIAQRTISGSVSDESGIPLIGATVLEKGTSNGTVSDADGSFSLTVGDGAVLIVSYIGHETREIPTDGVSELDIVLAESARGARRAEMPLRASGWR